MGLFIPSNYSKAGRTAAAGASGETTAKNGHATRTPPFLILKSSVLSVSGLVSDHTFPSFVVPGFSHCSIYKLYVLGDIDKE